MSSAIRPYGNLTQVFDEGLILVSSYLTRFDVARVSAVNRRFRAIEEIYRSRTKELDLSIDPAIKAPLDQAGLFRAVDQYPALTRLNLNGQKELTRHCLTTILRARPQIRELHLRHCRLLSDRTPLEFCEYFQGKEDVRLSLADGEQLPPTQYTLLFQDLHFPTLRSLDISSDRYTQAGHGLTKHNIAHLAALLPTCTALEELRVTLAIGGYDHIWQQYKACFENLPPSIQRLDLSHTHLTDEFVALLLPVIKKLVNLRSIDLVTNAGYFNSVTAEPFQQLVAALPIERMTRVALISHFLTSPILRELAARLSHATAMREIELVINSDVEKDPILALVHAIQPVCRKFHIAAYIPSTQNKKIKRALANKLVVMPDLRDVRLGKKHIHGQKEVNKFLSERGLRDGLSAEKKSEREEAKTLYAKLGGFNSTIFQLINRSQAEIAQALPALQEQFNQAKIAIESHLDAIYKWCGQPGYRVANRLASIQRSINLLRTI
jgi:hypothetical protein